MQCPKGKSSKIPVAETVTEQIYVSFLHIIYSFINANSIN
jgi:hypothetical protein